MGKRKQALPRPLTAPEKKQALVYWPNMNVDNVLVTDEAKTVYNCLAWTLGITNAWVWPWGSREATKDELDEFYAQHGFNPSTSGEIAGLGPNPDKYGHVSISGDGHGPRWESKAGSWLRIQHGLGEMEGGTYGDVHRFYTQAVVIFSEKDRGDSLKILGVLDMLHELSEEERIILGKKVGAVDVRLRHEFEKRYSAWRATWGHPLIAVSSAPYHRTNSTEFLDLIALGRDIVPLLMEKLSRNEDFFALQALERLGRAELFIRRDPKDPAILAGEQGRAREVLKRWIALEG